MVASLPTAIAAAPRALVRLLQGFATEVLAVLRGIARPLLRVAPAPRTRRGSSGAGAGAGAGTAAADADSPWLDTAAPVADEPFTTGRARRAPSTRRTPAQLRAAAERRERLRRQLRIGVVAALLVAVVAAWIVVPASDAFRIRHVEVSGAAAVDDLQVRQRIDSLLVGKTVFTVDEDAVVSRVEELPFVREARVERHLPGGLEIHVSEYRPLALAWSGGDFWLVAQDGRILAKANGDAWKGRIPTVTLLGDDIKAGDRVGDEPALQLLRARPRNSSVAFDVVRADGVKLEADLVGGIEVRFGRPVQLMLKVAALERAIELVRRSGKADEIMYVDVSVPAKPAVCLDSVFECHQPRGPQKDAAAATDSGAATAQTGAPTTPEEVGGDEANPADLVA